jgi:hypothetical protein
VASNHLFNGRDLAADLGANRKQVMDALNAWDDDDFLARTDADLITELVAVGAVECPELKNPRPRQPQPRRASEWSLRTPLR